jgi:nucleoside-diphosphate-sugar epimerase
MSQLVVTGGAGYVGSVVTAHLLMAGHSVCVFDSLAAGGEGLLAFMGHPRFRLVHGDVRDAATLRAALNGADAAIHLAAVVGEPACAVDEANAHSINVAGTRSVLDAADGSAIGRVIVVSTCSNYGVSNANELANEDSPLRPLGIYARSKVEAEEMALAHRGVATHVLRFGTICGLSPRMRFDLLVNDMARAVALGETIQIFAPDAWRPFLHIHDAGRAVEWCLQADPSRLNRRVFNVVGDNYQKKGLVDLVRRHFPAAAIDLTNAIPDARDYRVSAARIRDEGGFSPAHTVEDAFLEITAAVRGGVFRDPKWSGHAAAPAMPDCVR